MPCRRAPDPSQLAERLFARTPAGGEAIGNTAALLKPLKAQCQVEGIGTT